MINYERRGSGEPLVLIHGIGMRWQAFEPVLDLLAERFDVVSVDLPGFGESPHPGGEVTVYRLADLIEKFCSDIALDRPHVAGNSMGGGIALELGSRGLARSVTAFSPIGFWHTPGRVWTQQAIRLGRTATAVARPPWLHGAVARACMPAFFGRPRWSDAVALMDDVQNAAALPEALASFSDFHVDPLKLDGVPVTVAWGPRDILLTYATQSRNARKLLPGARHVTLRGCGHVPFSDDPQACADVLLDQLKGSKA